MKKSLKPLLTNTECPALRTFLCNLTTSLELYNISFFTFNEPLLTLIISFPWVTVPVQESASSERTIVVHVGGMDGNTTLTDLVAYKSTFKFIMQIINAV